MSALFTRVGTSHYKQIDWGSQPLPGCQAHLLRDWKTSICPNPGEFDCPTPEGPWADLCRVHAELFATHNSQLGFHRRMTG